MKKIVLVLIIGLLTLSAAGCTLPLGGTGGKVSPTPTPYPTDITPGVITTQQPPVTATPAPSHWLGGYKEVNVNREQYLPGGMKVRLDKIYYDTADWKMPFPLGGVSTKAANHGAVLLVKFYNPSSNTRQIVLDTDVKTSFSYFDQNGVRHGLITADVFYDPDTGKTFMETSVAPGQTKSLWILSYVSSDEDYEKYGAKLDTPTLDANPGYVPM
ncbi:hypothetical protein [Methanocella sp. MCL-LM]|uniref:hypothetical protein n=1 Tax=Methanocella sp. MCL-LM TaxID=3412035 RepID=UPI003C716C0D